MHLREVTYFLALCDEKNFIRAARRCGVTQPSISVAIRQLEAKFGGPLFDRNRRTTRLSPLGEIVRPYLADIARSAAQARHEAARFLATGPINSVPTLEPKEKSMRKVVYSVVVLSAFLLFVSIVNVRSQVPTVASAPTSASNIVDVRAIEATIDMTALPRQDILSEADE
jgi:hypothetical protein